MTHSLRARRRHTSRARALLFVRVTMRASLNHDEDTADRIDLAQALNAMVERKDLQDGYDADGSPLEIAFLCVVS